MWNQTQSVLLLLGAAFALYACNQETGAGQQNYPVAQEKYTVVADLAIAVMLKPEAGDQIIVNNRTLYNSRFYAALDDRTNFWRALAAKHFEFCDQYRTQPRSNQQCYQENEPDKNRHLLQTLKNATQNNTPWSQSAMGQVSVMGKQVLGEDAWVPQMKTHFAKIRHLFIVK